MYFMSVYRFKYVSIKMRRLNNNGACFVCFSKWAPIQDGGRTRCGGVAI